MSPVDKSDVSSRQNERTAPEAEHPVPSLCERGARPRDCRRRSSRPLLLSNTVPSNFVRDCSVARRLLVLVLMARVSERKPVMSRSEAPGSSPTGPCFEENSTSAGARIRAALAAIGRCVRGPVGVALAVTGLVGLVLPIVPGVPLLFVGLSVLGREHALSRLLARWATRYQGLDRVLRRVKLAAILPLPTNALAPELLRARRWRS
jgi:Putative transmembrane protein (PGPGW)